MAKAKVTSEKTGIIVDATPQFDLSPNLYTQFMEPLGATDGSVESSWDHLKEDWRPDIVEITKKIRPGMLRWGGCFSSSYRWREAVGPRKDRVPMPNLMWGGIESNQIGTHELVDLCRRAKTKPFYCVNFESDGREKWYKTEKWGVRKAGPNEAAEWVDYCNNPDNAERKKNGAKDPFDLKLWQLGNETSYDPNGYDCETAAKRTIAFAKAMRKADPDVELIAWGDSGWAPRMIEIAGEYVDYVAFHSGYRSNLKNQPFADDQYRKDPDKTWDHLMTAADWGMKKLKRMRQETDGLGVPLALTEGHFGSVPGLGRGRFFTTWGVGAAYARILNMYQRAGDVLKMAIICDYAGTKWLCHGVIIPSIYGKAFMLPVTHVMTLYSHHVGKKSVAVSNTPTYLDVTASRTGKKVFLHVVNTRRTASVKTSLKIDGMKIESGKVFTIAPPSTFEVFNRETSDQLEPVEKALPKSGEWSFPAASVSAVELTVSG